MSAISVNNCLSDKNYACIIKNCMGHHCELLEVEWRDLGGKIRGFLGNHRLLKLKVEDEVVGEKVLNFFVKTLIGCSFDDEDLYKKEVFAYEFIHSYEPGVDLIPKIYHHANQTIVLEDLCQKGYQGLETFNFDKAHMLIAIETLAKFHAVSLVYEEFKGKKMGGIYRMSDDYSNILKPRYCKDEDALGHRYMKAGWIGASTLVELVFKDDHRYQFWKMKINQMMNSMFDMLNEPNNYRKVFSHGDVWGNNLLFKYDHEGKPISCKIIDLQLIRYTPPAHDLTMLIYMASERKLYHSNVQEYYYHYYHKLTTELKLHGLDVASILPQEEFQETCRIYMPITKYIWLCYSQTMQAGDAVNLKVSKDWCYADKVIFSEGRADLVKELYATDPCYKKYMDLLLEDFRLTHTSEFITLEDCCAVIKQKCEDFEISDYTVIKIEDFDELKINVTTDTYNFIVKIMPKNRSFYKIITLMDSLEISTDFIAKCYLLTHTILITDDLKSLNYALNKQPLQLDKVKLGLDTIAKLHSSGIALEEKVDLQKGFHRDDFPSSKCLKEVEKLIRLYCNFTSVITLEEILEFVKNALMIKPECKYRKTITHGNLVINNLLFGANDCKLINFQCYYYSPPTRDFLQFIYANTDRDFRNKYLQECKEYYYEKLESLLENYNLRLSDILSFDNFLKSCEEEKVFVLSKVISCYQDMKVTTESQKEHLLDYKKMIKEIIVDLGEYCEAVLKKEKKV